MAGEILKNIKDFLKLDDYEEENEVYDDYEEEKLNTGTGDVRPVTRGNRNNNLETERIEKNYSRNSAVGNPPLRTVNGGRSKVMNLSANISMEVVVIQPTTYNDAKEISDKLKEKKPCVINLENCEYSISQRIMDFVSGACYTLEGNMESITNNIFLVTPVNVEILGDFQEEFKSNGLFDLEKKND